MSLQILRNAQVEARRIINTTSGAASLALDFPDGRSHVFSPISRESELLDVFGNDMKHITEMFKGGTFVFHNAKMVDYRRSDYKGFIHSDDNVAALIELVGMDAPNPRKPARGNAADAARGLFTRMRGRHTNGVFLGGEWDKFDLSIPDLGAGGEFENRLLYRWSPFSPNIQTSLEVERLVCNNGMVAMSPLVTHEVPVIADWEENLDVVAMQLKPRINALLKERFTGMETIRASIGDVQRVHQTLLGRMSDVEEQSGLRLERLSQLTDVERHLARYYEAAVFENKNMADRADSHLTQFALFNVLTEAATHTTSNERSDNGVQMAINRLVFDEAGRRQSLESRKIPAAEGSNPERAFFSSAGNDF